MPAKWFERYANCPCGKRPDGVLRGLMNESFGPYCRKCAERRIREETKSV
jgi:hypothetical protein